MAIPLMPKLEQCNAEEEQTEAAASCAGRHGKRKALKAFLHKLRHAPAAHATAAPDTIPASHPPPGLLTSSSLCRSVVVSFLSCH